MLTRLTKFSDISTCADTFPGTDPVMALLATEQRQALGGYRT